MITIDLQPSQLVRGDNRLSVIVRNTSESVCRGLTIRLMPGRNLFVDSKPLFTFMPIPPGQTAEETVDLSAMRVGSVKLVLRCSWSQQNRKYHEDISFTLEVVEKEVSSLEKQPVISQAQLTLSPEDEAFLREQLAIHKQNLRLLLRQKAVYAAGEEPLHLLNKIEAEKREIAAIQSKLAEVQVEATRSKPMSTTPKPIEIFYSYSHRDEELRDELEKHLTILKRQGVIQGWHDRRIGAGKEWEGEINTHLNTADVILLLISADFLASDYCYDVETRRAMERHKAGEVCVIPVILRPVDWKGAPFGKLQALPKDAVPVTEWPNRDKAFLNVAKGIRAAVRDLNS
jgi:hypothetical protein